jgi:phosphoribosylamine-glycine ligase
MRPCLPACAAQLACSVLEDLRGQEPQRALIDGATNAWIVKPAGKSRGRGIRLFSSSEALLGYVRDVSG